MSNRPNPANGKAKEQAGEPDWWNPRPESQDSMLNRVTQSAVGLMRSTWDSEGNSSIASNLAAWQSSAGKGESSSQGSHTNPCAGPTQSWKELKTQVLDKANGGSSKLPSCVGQFTSNGQEEFDRFLADSNGENGLYDARDLSQSPQTPSSDQSNRRSRLSAKVGNPTQDCTLFAHEDGAAVVALLSSRGPLSDDGPLDVLHLEACQFESHRELPKRTKQTDPALNLIPSWQEHIFQPVTQYGELGIDLISAETAPPGVRPWLEILDKYQDEVWGDKLAFVQAARLEVEEKREAGCMDPQILAQGPAFRRLKLLLSHIEHPI